MMIVPSAELHRESEAKIKEGRGEGRVGHVWGRGGRGQFLQSWLLFPGPLKLWGKWPSAGNCTSECHEEGSWWNITFSPPLPLPPLLLLSLLLLSLFLLSLLLLSLLLLSFSSPSSSCPSFSSPSFSGHFSLSCWRVLIPEREWPRGEVFT